MAQKNDNPQTEKLTLPINKYSIYELKSGVDNKIIEVILNNITHIVLRRKQIH